VLFCVLGRVDPVPSLLQTIVSNAMVSKKRSLGKKVCLTPSKMKSGSPILVAQTHSICTTSAKKHSVEAITPPTDGNKQCTYIPSLMLLRLGGAGRVVMVICLFAQKIPQVHEFWPSVHKIHGTLASISVNNQTDFQRLDGKPVQPWREIGTLN
jgi:hypothetical protein